MRRRVRRRSHEAQDRTRCTVGDPALSWIIIVGATLAAALAVVALYNALVEDQAEPLERIISAT